MPENFSLCKPNAYVGLHISQFSYFLNVYFFIHSFLLLSSFCHGFTSVSTLCASGFSTFHLCNFLFLMTWMTCIIIHCASWKSVPMYPYLKYVPVLHQGVYVKYWNRGNKVKRNKCIEMKIASANAEIKLKKCNALNSVFSRKVNCILLTILTQMIFETKRSLNRIIWKSGELSCVWRIENAWKVSKSNPGNLTRLSSVRYRLH